MEIINRLILVVLFVLAIWQYRGMRSMGYGWVTSFLAIGVIFVVAVTVVLGLVGFIATGTFSF